MNDLHSKLAALNARLRWRRRWRWLLQYGRVLADHLSRYGRLTRLHRPIGIWLLLWPTLWALWIASEGRPRQSVLIVLVLGTIIVRSAGCIINDFADRNIDPHVERTAGRPLATGEVAYSEAFVLFVGLMLIALGLAMTMNPLTVKLALSAGAITVIYPFTKRFFAAPQLALGIAFAWGVPMAFAAETAAVPRIGWLLFLTSVIWGIVYDTEYAMADREDDLEIGVRSTAVLFGEMDRALIGVLQICVLTGLALVGQGADLGRWYFGGLLAAAAFAGYQQHLIKDRARDRCFAAFINNAWFGGAVFTGLVLDYLYRG